jgi:DNA mismatch endonuclease (patch repair protein)
LPGKPDIVFPAARAVIFVHGCFWHGHDCPAGVTPKTNENFWIEKITSNRNRDRLVQTQLRSEGWRVLTVWECATRGGAKGSLPALLDRVSDWLRGSAPIAEMSTRGTQSHDDTARTHTLLSRDCAQRSTASSLKVKK